MSKASHRPEVTAPLGQPRPFVFRTRSKISLHFSIDATQSRMRLRAPDTLDVAYTRTMMAFLLFAPTPAKMLLMGLGGGSLAKFCHRNLPATQIDVVEINPDVIALREQFKVPPDGDRFRVHQADAADFIRLSDEQFDIVLIDAYGREGLPPQTMSVEFYEKCFAHLTHGGVVVANLHAPRAIANVCVRRLQQFCAGPVLSVELPDEENIVAFASKGETLADLRRLTGAGKRNGSRLPFSSLTVAFGLVDQAIAGHEASSTIASGTK